MTEVKVNPIITITCPDGNVDLPKIVLGEIKETKTDCFMSVVLSVCSWAKISKLINTNVYHLFQMLKFAEQFQIMPLIGTIHEYFRAKLAGNNADWMIAGHVLVSYNHDNIGIVIYQNALRVMTNFRRFMHHNPNCDHTHCCKSDTTQCIWSSSCCRHKKFDIAIKHDRNTIVEFYAKIIDRMPPQAHVDLAKFEIATLLNF